MTASVNKIKKLPIKEFNFQFSRSSGAGGQNINKVNSRATLSWNVRESKYYPSSLIERFIEKFSRRILEDGTLVISSQRFRTQASNIADCIEKLQTMINEVAIPPKERRATKPTRSSVEKRIKEKKVNSSVKKMRQKSNFQD